MLIRHSRSLARSSAQSLQQISISSGIQRDLHSSPLVKSSTASSSQSVASAHNGPMTIFSGIQPTGIPHLGNYLGALRQWVALQNDAAPSTTLYFSIVDLHSLTSRTQTPAERRASKRQTLASLLACGLDPKRSIIYHQSSVPQHAELHWILSCDASMGLLSRMTQWKSKLSDDGIVVGDPLDKSPNPRSTERLKLGLFSYPVLQAADVLLYSTTHVPVGEDQVQHIEFARSMANVFNSAFGRGQGDGDNAGPILVAPECIVSQAKRVMSLSEPEKKMSKSHPLPRSRVLLTDSADTIKKKIRAAVTDGEDGISYDPQRRPGVSNLLDIIAHLQGTDSTPQNVAADLQSMDVTGSRLRVLKDRAAESIIQQLRPIREKYEQLMGQRDGRELDHLAALGQEKARQKAEKTMVRVREATGLS